MKHQINALTSTRAIAAIMVFIHHYGRTTPPFSYYPPLFTSGHLAVSYFFVLSGFVLFLAYQDKNVEFSKYIKRRVARIVPLYLLALVLYLGIPLGLHTYTLPGNFSNQVIYSALFLQSCIPSYPITLNIPAWSVSVEMFFYLLFPVFLVFQLRRPKGFLFFAVILFIGSQLLHIIYFRQKAVIDDALVDFIFFNPLMHINQFLIGMLGGFLYLSLSAKGVRARFIPTLMLILIITVIVLRPPGLSYQTGLIAPLFMLLILTIALNKSKILNNRILVFLGEISFGIYILQLPVYEYLDYASIHFLHIPANWFFITSLSLLVAVATLCHFLVERPSQKLIAGQK